MVKSVIFLFVFLLFSSCTKVGATSLEKYITVVNPVRVAPYTQNILENLEVQYESIKSLDLPATWLVTYDILDNQKAISILREFNEKQEIGLWLEVGEKLADSASVEFNSTLAWHYSNKIFLSGYTQDQRERLIDNLFQKYKSIFGEYPTAVGSWWTDAYSLAYMHSKYGVIANMGVADQFSTDGYQVWGQYWSKPYIPSLDHSAIPSSNEENSSGVVNIQWAARDPYQGYFSSLYSLQDYAVPVIGKDIYYYKKILEVFVEDEFSGITNEAIGLESDLSTSTSYSRNSTHYTQLKLISELSDVSVKNMSEFARTYLDEYKFSQIYATVTDKFGEGTKVIWYQSPFYRVGIRIKENEKKIEIYDLRFYDQNFIDPYFYSPNRELELFINIPSIIDEFQNEEKWVIPYDKVDVKTIVEDKSIEVTFDENKLFLQKDRIFFEGKAFSIPAFVIDHPQLNIERASGTMILTANSIYKDYFEYKLLKPEFVYLFNSKKIVLMITLSLLIFTVIVIQLATNKRKKSAVTLVCLVLAAIWSVYYFNLENYYIASSELDTLNKLSSLEAGNVLVYNQDCLQCEYHTPYKPAAYLGNKSYVAKYSRKKIISVSDFEKMSREEGRKYLTDNNIRYIYLVKYEDFQEEIPYQPGDLHIKLIYSNANSQLWKVLP